MMVKAFNILVVIASILFIVSCNESNNSEKESFVQICTNADESLSDKTCGCIYDKQHDNKELFKKIVNYYQGINAFGTDNANYDETVNELSSIVLARLVMGGIEKSCKSWFDLLLENYY